jgi:hypothetical protein
LPAFGLQPGNLRIRRRHQASRFLGVAEQLAATLEVGAGAGHFGGQPKAPGEFLRA